MKKLLLIALLPLFLFASCLGLQGVAGLDGTSWRVGTFIDLHNNPLGHFMRWEPFSSPFIIGGTWHRFPNSGNIVIQNLQFSDMQGLAFVIWDENLAPVSIGAHSYAQLTLNGQYRFNADFYNSRVIVSYSTDLERILSQGNNVNFEVAFVMAVGGMPYYFRFAFTPWGFHRALAHIRAL